MSSNEITAGLVAVDTADDDTDLKLLPEFLSNCSVPFTEGVEKFMPLFFSCAGPKFCFLTLLGDLPYGENRASIFCFSLLSFNNHFFSTSPIDIRSK